MIIKDGDATRHAIRQGVPQAGVLSPTLFILCLIYSTKALFHGVRIPLYADDICIWA